MKTHSDFSPAELESILWDRLFQSISSAGVNGGEPFIKNDLLDYVAVLTRTLPELKNLHFISNGYFTENMTESLPLIKQMCHERGISVTLQLSVDGIGKLQDFTRGNKNAFSHLEETCDALLKSPDKYYDNISFVCTITKHNVYNLYEVETWAREKGVLVNYNIATIHERVFNAGKFEDFTIFNDDLARRMAAEFFYMKFVETRLQKYFALYYYIARRKRVGQCDYRYNTGVTLTPDRQLAYCATYSKELGDALMTSASELFYGNLEYRRRLCTEKCDACSHYMNTLNREGFFLYVSEFVNRRRLFY